MSQPHRLAAGGRIDRSRPVNFRFNGKAFQGFHGDTLASALLANNVRVVSRSFKFHRPRGVFSAGVEEPNALLAVDTGAGLVALARATLLPLSEGLVANSQNCFPSPGFDLGRVFDFSRSLWPAGFYNKTFKWPSWHLYEPVIRRMAGLGKLPGGNNPTRYRHMNAHCDVLIVGMGLHGLQAALAAARSGEDVLIAELDTLAGGSLLYDPMEIGDQMSDDWLVDTRTELHQRDNVRILMRSTVAGYYDHNVLTIHDQSAAFGDNPVETFWKVRTGRVVLASGAIEQPLMFANNDLPGVMLASAVQQYAARYGVACGHQVVGLVNNDLGWHSLLAASAQGVKLQCIADLRDKVRADLLQAAGAQGVDVHLGITPLRAYGGSTVRAMEIRKAGGVRVKLKCDAISMAGGLNPTVHLYSQAGGVLRFDESLACFVPASCRQAISVVGAANGEFAEPTRYNIAARDCAPTHSNSQWVDFQHDVTVADIELAVRENYVSVEHLKRYTTTGMSVDQGKTSNLNALSLLGKLTGRAPGEVGTTTFRPQFMPVSMGAIAGNRQGEFFAPRRRLPAHNWHRARDAVFEEYGGWERPAHYGADRQASIEKEMMAVRQSAGLFDGSPLGKIEVKGPDTAEFLNRVYLNKVPSLTPGKVRYGLMLNENGIVMDDGVFVRLADDHFLINTTSAGAHRVSDWLEEWRQCVWPDLDVLMVPVTSQWAVATVAGPRARNILSLLPGMIDLSTDQFPHMSFAASCFDDGSSYRIQRVSYSGELSYEVSVPANQAAALFQALSELGKDFGLQSIGIEALMCLRLEKGFLHVGVDTDGMTNAIDVGFGQIVANKASDFIGKRSLYRSNDQRKDRRQLVGLEASRPDLVIQPGAHFVARVSGKQRSEGFVSSACFSPLLGKTIGLGLLEGGFDRLGEKITVFNNGATTTARIVDACFYDAEGTRMRA